MNWALVVGARPTLSSKRQCDLFTVTILVYSARTLDAWIIDAAGRLHSFRLVQVKTDKVVALSGAPRRPRANTKLQNLRDIELKSCIFPLARCFIK